MYMDKRELPRRGELVVATVDEIRDYGAYLTIEDYGIKGFLPISEVSSRWIRGIDDVLRIGQKIVVKVLRIDKLTKSVDVSLKEVAPGERDRVLREWKRNRRGKKLLEEAAAEIGTTFEKLYEMLGEIVEDYYNLYDLVLNIVSYPSILDKTALTEREKEKILRHLSKKVRPKKYILELLVEASYVGSGGVYKIIETFNLIEKAINRIKNINSEITHIAAPRYSIKLSSLDPALIRKAQKEIKNALSKINHKVNFVIKEEIEKIEI